jgi:hypothetical protein
MQDRLKTVLPLGSSVYLPFICSGLKGMINKNQRVFGSATGVNGEHAS